MKYYVKHNNEELGPYRLDDIQSMLKKELLPKFIKIRSEFDDNWRALTDFTQHIDLNSEDFTFTDSIFKQLKKEETSKIVLKKNNDDAELINDNDLDKTILSKNTQIELDENTISIKENLNKTFKQLTTRKSQVDKTKFYDIDEFKGALQEAQETEDLLKRKRRDIEEVKEATKDPVNRGLFLAILLCLLAFLFLDDPKEEEVIVESKEEFLFPEITQIEEVIGGNVDKSDSILDKSKKYTFYQYEDLLQKSKLYKEALDVFYNKDAVLKLSKTYGLLLPFTKEKEQASNIIASLLEVLGEEKMFKQPMNFEAWIIFYHNIKKYAAVKFLVESYLRVNDKITAITLSFFFSSLHHLGEYEALETYKSQLAKSLDQTPYAYNALLEYLLVENRFKDYGKVAYRGYKKFPKSLLIIRHLIKFLILDERYKDALSLLKTYEKREYDHHPIYKAFYLESMGVLKSIDGKFQDAQKDFDLAIKLNPESEIVTKLSNLETSDQYKETTDLINRSKAINFVRRSQREIKEKKFQNALSTALDAVDAFESPEARLNLADIQRELGYYSEAIKNYEKVQRSESGLGTQNINLLRTYVESYQFGKANKLINKISNLPLASSSRYKESVSDFYFKQGQYAKALYWLNLSTKENKINDRGHYKIANIRFNNGSITEAKRRILKAIKFDPSNLDYRILYSKIKKEEDGVETAIGYLRSIKKNFLEHTKIKNQIAVFYYESGQINSFEDLIKEVVIDDKENADFYLYMMNAASIEENDSLAISYAKKYMLVNPGNHEVGIELSKSYLRLLKFDEAEKVLLRIQAKIKSFPEVNSLLSHIYFLKGEMDKAQAYAEAEIKFNPRRTYGYVQLAKIFEKNGDLGGASMHLNKAKRFDAEDMDMLKTFGDLKLKMGQPNEAMKLFEKALEIDGEDHYLYFQLAEVYKNMGKSKEAARNYRTYLDLFPDAPEKNEIREFLSLLE